MRTRKVSVYVFSYPEKHKFSLYELGELGEVLEQSEKFLTDKSLEEVLQSYVDKTEVFASFVENIQWYRIVVRDTEGRLLKIFKA